MQSEYRGTEVNGGSAEPTACPSCRAALVAGMRFCRMCGYRLGEGVEEYAETRRFDGTMPTAARPTANAAPRVTMPGQWGAVAPVNTSSLEHPRKSSMWWNWTRVCHPMRMNWMMWMILSIAILSATGVVSRRVAGLRRGPMINIVAPHSFLGVDGFDTADGGGAMIQGIAAPDTPVERAGLIGGDIINSFDGKPVADDDAMREILAATPVGKTVEVVYTRDSATAKTILTTISEKNFRGLSPLDERPGGKGIIGVDTSDLEHVRVPNSNTYGVQLGDVKRNGPADLAGLRQGDIVTDFGGKPIRTGGDLRLRIYEAVPGSTVPVVVMRGGERLEIPVKIGRGKD
ncbi:MAG: PDZ domain-containing protein [Acidobacteria bacterium]|nr:PDZ domain-containing protein [Acidobacteriota bacterium]